VSLAAVSPPERRGYALSGLAAFLLIAGTAGWLLWRFPPEMYHFYPVCPIHELLHLDCPGCGTTRALAALLHGRFAEALRLNALAVLVVLPGAAVYGAVAGWRAVRAGNFSWPQVPGWAVAAVVGVVVGFTVFRNL
jgi:hypothetical protein